MALLSLEDLLPGGGSSSSMGSLLSLLLDSALGQTSDGPGALDNIPNPLFQLDVAPAARRIRAPQGLRADQLRAAQQGFGSLNVQIEGLNLPTF